MSFFAVPDCKKRWKNIKDTYDRRRKERTPKDSIADPAKKKKKWQLLDQLSFLHSTDNQRNAFSNDNSNRDDGILLGLEDSTNTSSKDGTDEDDERIPSAQTVSSADIVQCPTSNLLTTSSVDCRNVHRAPQTRRDAEMDKLINLLERRQQQRVALIQKLQEEDDVDLFFRSIAKSVKKMPKRYIHQAKKQTLELITNLEVQIADEHT